MLVTSVLLGTTAPLISAARASADTPGCVTRHEFNEVHRGMRMARVHDVFDTRGRLAWQKPTREARYHKICHVRLTRHQAVHVVYWKEQGVWVLHRKWADAQ